jgi:hypothetical protein
MSELTLRFVAACERLAAAAEFTAQSHAQIASACVAVARVIVERGGFAVIQPVDEMWRVEVSGHVYQTESSP